MPKPYNEPLWNPLGIVSAACQAMSTGWPNFLAADPGEGSRFQALRGSGLGVEGLGFGGLGVRGLGVEGFRFRGLGV